MHFGVLMFDLLLVEYYDRISARHGKPGKLQSYFPGLENSWDLRKMPKLIKKIFFNKKNV